MPNRLNEKQITLFIAGPGKVGSAFLRLVAERKEYLAARYNAKAKIAGIINSSKMLFKNDGFDLQNWKENLSASGIVSDVEKFIETIKEMNLPIPILLDCTANDSVVKFYNKIFESGISIVTPNKIANTQSYSEYLRLRETAKKNNVHFKYGTNVGSALPFISTLQNIVANGDEVIKIEGVFSGTLSFMFNTLKEKESFSDVVKIARDRGYTEPDPRDDLRGLDMARKLLILIRESGKEFELKDISIEKLISDESENAASVEEFFVKLKNDDKKIIERRRKAAESGRVLCYIAKYENNEASLSIQQIYNRHPFFNLVDGENIVSFTTKNYWKNPLTIKGQGAGAEFTSVGILSDILRIVNRNEFKL